MSGTVGILSFIATLFVMIVFHEFGHFITARRMGIRVDEFAIGFGPRLLSRTKGETIYSIRPIPFGGFVKIAGMNPFQPVHESDLPRTFGAKPSWQRAIVLGAGSFTHFVLGLVVLFIVYAIIGVPVDPTTTLESVQSQVTPPERFVVPPGQQSGPAKEAGLRPGDRITSIDGNELSNWDELRETIRANPGEELVIGAIRNGRPLEIRVTPAAATGKDEDSKTVTIGLIGIVPRFTVERQAPHAAVWSATKSTGILIGSSVVVIGRVFSPAGIGRIFSSLNESGERGLDDPIGLVGGARLTGQAATAGRIADILGTLVGFTVVIGVFNLLPLPPLDGGYLLILAIEKVRGRKVDLRKVVPVAVLVVGFLLFVQVALLYLDVVRPVTNPFQ